MKAYTSGEKVELDDEAVKLLDDTANLVETLKNQIEIDSSRARLWALARTDAEKLHAWIRYVLTAELA